MDFSSEVVFEFIDLFEKEPILWNPKHPLHKNRNEMRNAWKRIQFSLSQECSVEVLKRKKDSLMSIFRSLWKKVTLSARSGVAPEDVFKPSWFAFERMAKFLTPVYEARSAPNFEDLEDNELLVDESTVPKESFKTEPDCNLATSTPKAKKRRKLASSEPMEPQLVDPYDIVQVQTVPEKDICTLYGQLLSSKLREFDDYNRTIVMNEIDNLVFRAKMQHTVASPLPHPPSGYSQQFTDSGYVRADTQYSPVQSPSLQLASDALHNNHTLPSTSFSHSEEEENVSKKAVSILG